MTELSRTEFISELTTTQQLIKTITENHASKLFRFPYGARDTSLIQLLEEKGFSVVSWTIDSKDWTGISAAEIYNNIMNSKYLHNGTIILLHTTGEHTAEALDLIIPALKRKHYKFMTISDLFQKVPMYRWTSMHNVSKSFNRSSL